MRSPAASPRALRSRMTWLYSAAVAVGGGRPCHSASIRASVVTTALACMSSDARTVRGIPPRSSIGPFSSSTDNAPSSVKRMVPPIAGPVRLEHRGFPTTVEL